MKNVSENIQEMPQSRSTALPRHQKKEGEEQVMRKQMKPQAQKEEMQQRNRIGKLHSQGSSFQKVRHANKTWE